MDSLFETPFTNVPKSGGEARVRALLRRDASERSPILRFLDLTLDTRTHEGKRGERPFSLSSVADASHELRTPVAVIRNKAEVALLRSRSPNEYCTALQSIHAETERLSHLINDLLALARGDEGQARFECEAVHLDRLVESVAANAQGLAEEHGQGFTPPLVLAHLDVESLILAVVQLVHLTLLLCQVLDRSQQLTLLPAVLFTLGKLTIAGVVGFPLPLLVLLDLGIGHGFFLLDGLT